MGTHILIIDDEVKLRALLSRIITMEGFDVIQAGDCKTGLKKLEQSDFEIVICDVKLPDGSGVELTKKIKEKYPLIEIILLTAYGNIPDSVQAIKNGAFDYITKGDDNNRIVPLVYRAIEKAALSKRVQQLEKQISADKYNFENIIGKSKNILAAIEAARKVACTDAIVLLTGETGTGKEVFAQAIHNNSSRSRNTFMAVNCSAFSKELLENELFGHKAGAFTGAARDSRGILEEANNGTVFLDEIGEMPLDLQAKLLRVLETGEFIKVGDSKITKVDVRVIAATNRNLHLEISSGHFREDLFYRISVFQIKLPSLGERVADIEELARYFLHLFTKKMNKKIHSFSKEYLAALQMHNWKGNIRELKNIIERSVILSDKPELDISTLPADFLQNSPVGAVAGDIFSLELASAEREHILKVLNYANGNKTETARLLNIALTTLYRKLEEYKIG